MKRVLKVGDRIYALSLQNFNDSYLSGFPQREQHLVKHSKNVHFAFFKHELLNDIETITNESARLNLFLKDKEFDYVMIDNPLSMLIIGKDIKIPVLFDCIDWYDEMYLKEFGINKRYYLLRFGFLKALERVDRVVCQSPVILDALKRWGLKTKKYKVIPNGYDANLFYPYTETRIKELKDEFEIAKQTGVSSKRERHKKSRAEIKNDLKRMINDYNRSGDSKGFVGDIGRSKDYAGPSKANLEALGIPSPILDKPFSVLDNQELKILSRALRQS